MKDIQYLNVAYIRNAVGGTLAFLQQVISARLEVVSKVCLDTLAAGYELTER